MISKRGITHFFQEAGIYATALTCFSIPLSTSLMGVFSGLTILCWVLSGKFLNSFKVLKHPVVLFSTTLFILFAFGLLYSTASLEEAFDCLRKYRELLYFLVIFSLFHGKPQAIALCLKAFFFGLVILLLSSYGMHFGLLPIKAYGDSFIHHITHSFFMAVLAYWSIHHAIESKQYRYLWLVIYLGATINLVFFAPGRTGMLTYLVLTILFMVQRLSFKYFIAGAILVVTLFTTIYYTSDNVSSRTKQAVKEIKQYKPGESRTSIGMRFDWYHNSWQLIKQKPIIGHGTGSFPVEQKKLIKGTKTRPTNNPHNEYFFITTQVGVVGLVLFLSIFLSQVCCSFRLRPINRYLLQGVIFSMMTGCLINSFLFDSHQGHFFAILSALLCATKQSTETG